MKEFESYLFVENIKNKISRIKTYKIVLSLIFLITLFFSLLRFYRLNYLPLWLDEVTTAGYSTLNLQELTEIFILREINMSFYNLILNIWNHTFPINEFEFLRFFSVIFSILSIFAVYLLGKSIIKDEKKGKFIGSLASLFVSINAFHFIYAQELRSYSLVLLLTLLSTIILMKAIEGKNSYLLWFLYSIVTILAFYTHLFAIFIFISQIISFVYLPKEYLRRNFKGANFSLIIIFILSIPLLFLAFLQIGIHITWIAEPTINSIINVMINLSGMNLNLLFLYIIFTVLGVFTILRFKSKLLIEDWRLKLIILCLFIPICLSLIISEFKPLFLDRYFIIIIPYFTILTIIGILNLDSFFKLKNKNKLFLQVIIIFLFLAYSGLGIKYYFTEYKKEDFKNVSKFLSTKCENSSIYYYPYFIEQAIVFYDDSLGSANKKWYLEVGLKGNKYEALMVDSTSSNKVCLVSSNYETAVLSKKNKEIGTVIYDFQKLLNNKFLKSEKYDISLFTIFIYSEIK